MLSVYRLVADKYEVEIFLFRNMNLSKTANDHREILSIQRQEADKYEVEIFLFRNTNLTRLPIVIERCFPFIDKRLTNIRLNCSFLGIQILPNCQPK